MHDPYGTVIQSTIPGRDVNLTPQLIEDFETLKLENKNTDNMHTISGTPYGHQLSGLGASSKQNKVSFYPDAHGGMSAPDYLDNTTMMTKGSVEIALPQTS